MSIFRTPEARFEGLPGYDFDPCYHTVEGPSGHQLRMHYLDEGEGDGSPVVCLHGEPTWSYMYRNVIPPLVEAGHRVVVPDAVGFGRSDKLTDPSDYSLQMAVDHLHALIEAVDIAGITLVVHDWGGMIGMAYAAHYPERVARLVIMNTFLPTGEEEKSRGYLAWRRFVEKTPDLPVGTVVERAIQDADHWSDDVRAAYDAPFPTPESKAGAAVWPLLVPMSGDDPMAEVMRRTRSRLARWSKPALVLFAPDDPILGEAFSFFRSLIPTASREPEALLPGAGHFVPEERGTSVAKHILDFLGRTSGSSKADAPWGPAFPSLGE